MKQRISLLLIFCMIFSMFSLVGCSKSDVAFIQEELSQQYEWEEIFVSKLDGETLSISRRHDNGFLGIHCTFFKITIHNEYDICTHFYSSGYTPCKNGLLKCNGEMADLEDAAALDSTIEELYPYVADVTGYLVIEKMVAGDISSEEIAQELFIDMVDSYFASTKEDIISEVKVSAINSVVDYNDYASKLAEVGFSIQEGNEIAENTKDTTAFAKFLIPMLEDIEEDLELIKLFFGIKHATANKQLDKIVAKNENPKTPEEVIIESKKELHAKFKNLMEDKD